MISPELIKGRCAGACSSACHFKRSVYVSENYLPGSRRVVVHFALLRRESVYSLPVLNRFAADRAYAE